VPAGAENGEEVRGRGAWLAWVWRPAQRLQDEEETESCKDGEREEEEYRGEDGEDG
jgi:hypothetical protein